MQSSTLFQTTPENLVELLRIAVREELSNLNPSDIKSEDELLTPKEASDFLNITKTTLWRWNKSDKINVYGTGKKRYYKKAELLDLLILKR